ncbi:MAG: DNA adenine methylase [Syntrophomonas sp.]
MYNYFSYYGGKSRFVFEMRHLIPRSCNIYVEAFAGSGVLNLNSPLVFDITILNDRDYGIYLLHNLMADKKTQNELITRLTNVEYSQDAFNNALLLQGEDNKFTGLSEMEAAEAKFILLTQSFNSNQKNWAGGDTQNAYNRRLKYNLHSVKQKYSGVTVTNLDAMDLINEYKMNEKAILVLDPPYLHRVRGKGATNVYKCEMNDEQHKKLLNLINDAKCKIVLFGYFSTLYDTALDGKQWNSFVLKRVSKSCEVVQAGNQKTKVEEWVWINYPPPESAQFYIPGLREQRKSLA